MPSKYDSCIKKIKAKIRSKEIPKTFRCDAKGKPNKRGKKRCRSDPYKICSKLK